MRVKKESLSLLVVGGGNLGQTYIPLLLRRGFRVVCVEPNKSIRMLVQRMYESVEVYASIEDCIAEEQISVAIITTPPDSHAALLFKLLSLGLRVYVEKPGLTSVGDLERAKDLSHANQTSFMIGTQYDSEVGISEYLEKETKIARCECLDTSNLLANKHWSESSEEFVVRQAVDLLPHFISVLTTANIQPDEVESRFVRNVNNNISGVHITFFKNQVLVGDVFYDFNSNLSISEFNIFGKSSVYTYNLKLGSSFIRNFTGNPLLDRVIPNFGYGLNISIKALFHPLMLLLKYRSSYDLSVRKIAAFAHEGVKNRDYFDYVCLMNKATNSLTTLIPMIPKNDSVEKVISHQNSEFSPDIIIVGGGGFIGRALTIELAKIGKEVLIISRKPLDLNFIPNEEKVKVKLLSGPLKEIRFDTLTSKKYCALINLAAPLSGTYTQQVAQSREILDFIERIYSWKKTQVIHVSSYSVLDNSIWSAHEGGEEYVNNILRKGPYSYSKYMSEVELAEFIDSQDLSILRPGSVYSADVFSSVLPVLGRIKGRVLIAGSGGRRLPAIELKSVIEFIMARLVAREPGVHVLLDSRSVTAREFFEAHYPNQAAIFIWRPLIVVVSLLLRIITPKHSSYPCVSVQLENFSKSA